MPRYKRNSKDIASIAYPIKAVASRAVIAGPMRDVEMVSIQLTDRNGVIYQFDLEVKVARELIEHMTASYHAIVPVLRTARSGWGG